MSITASSLSLNGSATVNDATGVDWLSEIYLRKLMGRQFWDRPWGDERKQGHTHESPRRGCDAVCVNET